MQRLRRCSVLVGVVLACQSWVQAQPNFQLTVDVPAAVSGEAGETIQFDASALLSSSGIVTPDGVEGWSLGVRAQGFSIIAATTAGTAGALVAGGGLRLEDGFENIQLTTGTDNVGVVAAVVLSTATEVSLPPAGTERVLRLTLSADVPNPVVTGGQFFCDPLEGRVFFADGLRGSGQPVKNKVSYRGFDYRPALGSSVVSVCPRLDQPRFTLSFDQPPTLLGEAGEAASFEASALLTTDMNTSSNGAEGWSVSISSQGGEIISATTAGTVSALFSSGGLRRTDGFEKTELTTGAGNQGVISAVALSSSEGATLPATGTQRILRFTVRALTPQPITAGGQFQCKPLGIRLGYLDGLRGSGQPVRNRVSFRGLGQVPALVAGNTELCPRIRQPRYTYTVSAPASLVGAPGSTVSYDAYCNLGSSDNTGSDGAEGWSVSLSSSGGTIAQAALNGTAGALDTQGGFRTSDGFEKTELTSGAGNVGVVSAVVLSTQGGVTLPPGGAVRILKLTVNGIVPQPVIGPGGDEICVPLSSVLTFVDGLRGSGQPVSNRVSYRGLSYRPNLTSTRTILCPPLSNPFAMRVSVLDPAAASEGNLGDKEAFRLDVPVGSPDVEATVGVHLESTLPGRTDGALGWAFSLETETAFGITSSSSTGTAYEAFGLNGFNKTENVNPALNGGRRGLVSAVVLSLSESRTLPANGEQLLLKVTGRLDTSSIQAGGDSTAPVCVEIVSPLEPGLKGSGARVDTVVTLFNPVSSVSESRSPQTRGAALRAVGLAGGRFIRGDANDDFNVDISDPVWVLDYLFRGGAEITCLDAADGNNDGKVDISDPIYVLGFLFLGTVAPPQPYPSCGLDPEADVDGLTCAQVQAGC